jgi:hypothetical protein
VVLPLQKLVWVLHEVLELGPGLGGQSVMHFGVVFHDPPQVRRALAAGLPGLALQTTEHRFGHRGFGIPRRRSFSGRRALRRSHFHKYIEAIAGSGGSGRFGPNLAASGRIWPLLFFGDRRRHAVSCNAGSPRRKPPGRMAPRVHASPYGIPYGIALEEVWKGPFVPIKPPPM